MSIGYRCRVSRAQLTSLRSARRRASAITNLTARPPSNSASPARLLGATLKSGRRRAVDRPEGRPLPPYEPEYDPEPPTDHLSFALGVALGRFGPNGEGILDPTKDDLSHALPAGILFLDGTLDDDDYRDSLGHPAAAPLHDAWASTVRPSIPTARACASGWRSTSSRTSTRACTRTGRSTGRSRRRRRPSSPG